ncbi:uncharacterized protein PAC_17706 [Phialocephala subalpina]|uniref:NADP-dependent oxidoreductase domain-containing protein n=1 Tax=Phialocephala subalpina TaxID=576137 RepID=A0A1L7XS87_9HELO|nr:uncharacterized protein PAC_17706 [Phialocephala subalpina]
MKQADISAKTQRSRVSYSHLQILIDSRFNIVTNQVSCSVIDRRVTQGHLNEMCLKNGVGLLCYGTILGGFISEKWVGQPEPTDITELDWSLLKYLRFISAASGLDVFQGVLQMLAAIARKCCVPVSAVATRYVLDIPSVKVVIVGTRPATNSETYIASNLKAFSFKLDGDDSSSISKPRTRSKTCRETVSDEYRRPPYLTAAGDLSDHLGEETERSCRVREAIERGLRVEYCSGNKWEPIAATPSMSPVSELPIVGGSSPGSQTVRILDIIEGALKALGSYMKDVVRTRTLVEDLKYCEGSQSCSWLAI